MQIFVPYPSPIECAEALWNDYKRYNKQLIETKQIIAAIDGAKAWRNHPICLMYKEHKHWLKLYLECFEQYKLFEENINPLDMIIHGNLAIDFSEKADEIRPSFLTEEFCDQHKRRLFTKAPKLYPQFAKYGKSDINYYVVNGELLKYRNGKRIKE